MNRSILEGHGRFVRIQADHALVFPDDLHFYITSYNVDSSDHRIPAIVN